MLQSADLKVNVVFIFNDEPCKVLSYKHTHMGRQGANISLKIRGLISGNVIPLGLSGTDRFEEAGLDKKKMQFLYKEEDNLIFMNPTTYEQVEIEAENMGEEIVFLKEGEEYNVLYWDEKALSIEIPPKVDLDVIDCDPGVKGNSAANMYKSATLEGGVSIRVPLFINQGEKIRVDTVNRKYVERAK